MRFISGIIFIVIAIALFFGVTNPKYQTTKAVRDKVAQLDEALDRAKELTALRDELSTRYNSFSDAEIKRLNTLLPDSIDTVRLIIDIDNVADAHDLTLLNIAISEDGTAAQVVGPDSRPYGTMIISFNVLTTYDRFKTFLSDLERSLRILDVDSISFGQEDPVTGRTTYTIRARTYWLR